MDMEPAARSPKPETGKPAEPTAERGAEELRRSEALGERLHSFEKDMGDAERMLEQVKDPKKREEFRASLDRFRGRAGGVGNTLRGVVAGLALFAGGVGVGKGMSDERHEASVTALAKQAGAAEAKNAMLEGRLAEKRVEAPAPAHNTTAEKATGKAMDALSGENAALRRQLDGMAAELANLRRERDEANARVLAEKEKGIVTQDSLLKQQTVSGNLQTLYEKMKDLIDESGDPKLKNDADRFLKAYGG